MATLRALRETMRSQVGDISKLAKEQRFLNEDLEKHLFDAMWQHAHGVSWDKLPEGEEQLVLCLAKSRLAHDKALEYALDPKIAVGGSGIGRDKLGNASLLMQLYETFRDEYEDILTQLAGEGESDIIVSEFYKQHRPTGTYLPATAMPAPPIPEILGVTYAYDASKGTGTIWMEWNSNATTQVAYVQVHLSPLDDLDVLSSEVVLVRTLYDMTTDFFRQVGNELPKNRVGIAHTLNPTGNFSLMLTAYNWNLQTSRSKPFPFSANNYIDVGMDAYVLENA